MWKYIKQYLHFAVIAALLMIGEVSMDLLQPSLMRQIVDDGVLGLNNGGTGDLSLILTLGVKMIILVLFGGFCGSMNNVFSHLGCQNMGNEMRKDAFRQIMAFSFPQMDRFGTGSLITRVTNDITQVQSLITQFIRGIIRTSMLMAGSIFCLFRLNRQFGLIVLCALPFMLGCLIFCLYRANPLFPKLQAQLDEMNSILQEDISGIRMIKACVREAYEKLRFGKSNAGFSQTQLRFLVIFAFMNPMMNALMYLVVAIFLMSGSLQVQQGTATPGTIMAAITYVTQLLHGILMLVMLFQLISRGLASWKRVKEVLECQPDLKDGTFQEETSLHGQIEFRDVSFTYPGTSQRVLNHINLTIHSGETLAIMGATGCGKTTLINLILRFYDTTEGSILVDGIDVKSYRQKELRDKISVALQKSELFSLSLGENIAWGTPEAAPEQIRHAAGIAQADSFIQAAPEGYDTPVAERGTSLSGGQKQRVSIARAVLKPAEILIFDDSSSALDLKTEANLYAALEQSVPERTKILIAQRVASVRRADRILVLEHGAIADCGTHNELLERCPIYQDIYHSQLGEEAHGYAE
ncbi:MAG: ABC transporter ATP-binding protein [Candidatus Onthomonas sp.]